jgi:SAM-dependent methyltransferase
MRKSDLKYLACPYCKGPLIIRRIEKQTGDLIVKGELRCEACRKNYPVIRYIPRFVSSSNYAEGFGLEWNLHARTQYDEDMGDNLSETRFFNETGWRRNLSGQLIMEAGSGSGRFTEQAASTGAMVISVDLSSAVEANYASNGQKNNVLIVQGDLLRLPLKDNYFDKLFCFGVLQHTPSPEDTFRELIGYLKPGGKLAVDVYRKHPGLKGVISKLLPSKYWFRPVTKNLPPEKLYSWVKKYIDFIWPRTRFFTRMPRVWNKIKWRMLIADYSGGSVISDEKLKEFAILDTFDMLSPAYDYPQTLDTVRGWFRDAGLREIDVHYGYNGIEGRGVKP